MTDNLPTALPPTKLSKVPCDAPEAPAPPAAVLVQCPLERAGQRYRVIRARTCLACCHYNGMKLMCADDNEPYETRFAVICAAPMTRKLHSIEVFEP